MSVKSLIMNVNSVFIYSSYLNRYLYIFIFQNLYCFLFKCYTFILYMYMCVYVQLYVIPVWIVLIPVWVVLIRVWIIVLIRVWIVLEGREVSKIGRKMKDMSEPRNDEVRR